MGRPSLDANVNRVAAESAQEQQPEQPQQSQPLMPPPPPTPEGLERLYQGAKAMEARRQQKAREILAQQCTFKPQLIAAPRRLSLGGDGGSSSCVSPLSPVAVEERFNRLYLDAQTREAKRAQAVRALQEEVQRAGRPAITPRAHMMGGGKGGGEGRGKGGGGSGERLYDEARKMGERQAKRREEALARECTFHPVTGRAPSNPRLRAAAQGGTGTSFAQRAMDYQAKVDAKVACLKKEKEDQEAAKLTFKPHITHNNKNNKAAPAAHRSRGSGESVFDYLSRPMPHTSLTHEPTPDPDCTFKPSLPKRSSSAPRRPPPSTSPSPSPAAAAKTAAAVGPSSSPHGPTTKTNGPTTNGPTSGPTTARRSSTPIFQRLYEERTIKEEKLRALKAEACVEAAKDCTFTPRRASLTGHGPTRTSLGPTTPIRSSSAQRPRTPRCTPEGGLGGGERDGGVTPQSVFSRLYDEFKAQEQRTQSRREEQMQDMLRQCPFSPQLPHKTHTDKPHPSRLSLGNKENAWEEALAAQHPSSSSSCQPKTPDAAKPRPRSAIFERLALEVEMRKQKEAERLAQKEQHDLQGCTFSPKINPPTSSLSAPPKLSPIKPLHTVAALALGSQDMNQQRPEEEEERGEEQGSGVEKEKGGERREEEEGNGHVHNAEALTN